MLRSILKSIIVLIIYYSFVFLFEKLFIFILTKDAFLEIDTVYYLLTETLVFIIFIIISLLFIKKTVFTSSKKVSIKYKPIIIIIVVAIVLRIFEDPILRINYIINGLEIAEIGDFKLGKLSELLVIGINTVLFASIFEELFFRKIIMSFFNSKDMFLGILISTILFTLIHIDFHSIDVSKIITIFIFGFISCIIYIRFGLFYSILFHSSYNLIWFFIKIGLIRYWFVLKVLDFSYIYWTLIIISSLGIIFFLNKSINQIIKLNRRNHKSIDNICKKDSDNNR